MRKWGCVIGKGALSRIQPGAHESPSEMKPPMVWPSAGHSHELTAALCREDNKQNCKTQETCVLALSGGARRPPGSSGGTR